MPKRKSEQDDDQLEFLSWKIKKLKKKLSRRRSRSRSEDGDRTRRRRSKRSQTREFSPSERQTADNVTVEDLLESSRESRHSAEPAENPALTWNADDPPPASVRDGDTNTCTETVVAATAENKNCPDDTAGNEVENDLLDILGIDPSSTIEYGKEIHNELSTRLQHIATAGLTKEARKELNEKYLLPANCVKIGAPSMNPEIKAAVTETVMKRDKGIESRQKQLASAISGVANLLNIELEAKNKDPMRSKQLMDICRILCDIQHAETVTRRNFAIFSIKKELKEHLVSTKIEKYLFGDNLADTLKSAKAVTKSGSDLKTKVPSKPKPTSSTSNLNWKSPAPVRKQQSTARGRDTAPPPVPGPMRRSFRNSTHVSSSKPSQHPSKKPRRN